MRYILYLLLLMICGCSPAERISRSPEKILSLSAAATKILYDLEYPPAAIDEYSLIAAGTPHPPVIGKGGAVSREKITELGIDCVILWHYQLDSVSSFRKSGFQLIPLQPYRLTDHPALIRQLGKLTGKTEKAEQLCRDFYAELSEIPSASKTHKVYFELYGPMKSVGKESYIGDLLSASGGDVFNKKTGLINLENLLIYQPEVIFYVEGHGSAESIRKRPGFSNLPAVKNGRIYGIPRRSITEGIAPLEAIRLFQQHLSKEL